jgi:hypothetical protein
MGCAASIGANPIDAALMQALIETRKKRNVPDLTFTELLLKFPKVYDPSTGSMPHAGA